MVKRESRSSQRVVRTRRRTKKEEAGGRRTKEAQRSGARRLRRGRGYVREAEVENNETSSEGGRRGRPEGEDKGKREREKPEQQKVTTHRFSWLPGCLPRVQGTCRACGPAGLRARRVPGSHGGTASPPSCRGTEFERRDRRAVGDRTIG